MVRTNQEATEGNQDRESRTESSGDEEGEEDRDVGRTFSDAGEQHGDAIHHEKGRRQIHHHDHATPGTRAPVSQGITSVPSDSRWNGIADLYDQ